MERTQRAISFLRRHWMTATVALFLFVLLIAFLVLGWSTGFGARTSTQTTITRSYSDGVETTITETTARGKTLWDLMELLIVPVALAGGVVAFNWQAAKREAANKEDRYKEEALQRYFDTMRELLLERGLREALETWDPSSDMPALPVVDMAQTHTVAVLRRLDLRRRNEVLRFLMDTELLARPKGILHNAHLAEIDLTEAVLYNANLGGANLSKAILTGAFPLLADLRKATLNGAVLTRIFLHGADLSGASLKEADLSEARLPGVTVTPAQLREAKSLDGAIMPDGRKYEPGMLDGLDDWPRPDESEQAEE